MQDNTRLDPEAESYDEKSNELKEILSESPESNRTDPILDLSDEAGNLDDLSDDSPHDNDFIIDGDSNFVEEHKNDFVINSLEEREIKLREDLEEELYDYSNKIEDSNYVDDSYDIENIAENDKSNLPEVDEVSSRINAKQEHLQDSLVEKENSLSEYSETSVTGSHIVLKADDTDSLIDENVDTSEIIGDAQNKELEPSYIDENNSPDNIRLDTDNDSQVNIDNLDELQDSIVQEEILKEEQLIDSRLSEYPETSVTGNHIALKADDTDSLIDENVDTSEIIGDVQNKELEPSDIDEDTSPDNIGLDTDDISQVNIDNLDELQDSSVQEEILKEEQLINSRLSEYSEASVTGNHIALKADDTDSLIDENVDTSEIIGDVQNKELEPSDIDEDTSPDNIGLDTDDISQVNIDNLDELQNSSVQDENKQEEIVQEEQLIDTSLSLSEYSEASAVAEQKTLKDDSGSTDVNNEIDELAQKTENSLTDSHERNEKNEKTVEDISSDIFISKDSSDMKSNVDNFNQIDEESEGEIKDNSEEESSQEDSDNIYTRKKIGLSDNDKQLLKYITENCQKMSYFQIIRLLRRLTELQGGDPLRHIMVRAPLYSVNNERDILSVTPDIGIGFEIETNFLAIYGPYSPLPESFTVNLIDYENDGVLAPRHFLDILQAELHQIYFSYLLYGNTAIRCIEFDEAGINRYRKIIYKLIKIPINQLGKYFTSTEDFLRYGRLFMKSFRSSRYLYRILEDYFYRRGFDISFSIDETATDAFFVDNDKLSTLSKNASLGGVTLGNIVVGSQSVIVVRIQFKSLAKYFEFIYSDDIHIFINLVTFYLKVHWNLVFEAELPQDRDEFINEQSLTHLGVNSWMIVAEEELQNSDSITPFMLSSKILRSNMVFDENDPFSKLMQQYINEHPTDKNEGSSNKENTVSLTQVRSKIDKVIEELGSTSEMLGHSGINSMNIIYKGVEVSNENLKKPHMNNTQLNEIASTSHISSLSDTLLNTGDDGAIDVKSGSGLNTEKESDLLKLNPGENDSYDKRTKFIPNSYIVSRLEDRKTMLNELNAYQLSALKRDLKKVKYGADDYYIVQKTIHGIESPKFYYSNFDKSITDIKNETNTFNVKSDQNYYTKDYILEDIQEKIKSLVEKFDDANKKVKEKSINAPYILPPGLKSKNAQQIEYFYADRKEEEIEKQEDDLIPEPEIDSEEFASAETLIMPKIGDIDEKLLYIGEFDEMPNMHTQEVPSLKNLDPADLAKFGLQDSNDSKTDEEGYYDDDDDDDDN